MLLRIGVDIVDTQRLRRVLATRPSFRDIVYSPAEIALAASLGERRKAEFLAGRLAAKEAMLKALGVGMSSDVTLSEMETLTSECGAPVLRLFGEARRVAEELGFTDLQVSISHDAGIAIAFVIIV